MGAEGSQVFPPIFPQTHVVNLSHGLPLLNFFHGVNLPHGLPLLKLF